MLIRLATKFKVIKELFFPNINYNKRGRIPFQVYKEGITKNSNYLKHIKNPSTVKRTYLENTFNYLKEKIVTHTTLKILQTEVEMKLGTIFLAYPPTIKVNTNFTYITNNKGESNG